MARLVLVVLFLATLVALAAILARVAKAAQEVPMPTSGPKTTQTVSYILLIVLMFGVVTGWLGGL